MACFERLDEACFGEGFDADGTAFGIIRIGNFCGIQSVEMAKVARADQSIVGVSDGMFEHAVKFTDVAGPRVIAKQFHRFARDAGHADMADGANVRNDVF